MRPPRLVPSMVAQSTWQVLSSHWTFVGPSSLPRRHTARFAEAAVDTVEKAEPSEPEARERSWNSQNGRSPVSRWKVGALCWVSALLAGEAP